MTMADERGNQVSSLKSKPLTVQFIDQKLPQVLPGHIPALSGAPVHYDSQKGQYVPDREDVIPQRFTLPCRPEIKDTRAMLFWCDIFDDAMGRFKLTTTSKARCDGPFSIRNKVDWDSVYATLENARNQYQNKGGALGALRRVRRRVADNISPLAEATRTASKLSPDNTYSTPVLGAVEIILDVFKTTADVRQKVLGGFDDLIAMFSDVELFLGTFPGDENIRNASISITVSTLDAIEKAIRFFTSNDIVRGGKALLFRSQYEKPLQASLDAIHDQSKKLMEEAVKSHILQLHLFSEETQRIGNHILQTQERLYEGQQRIVEVQVTGYNSLNNLFTDYLMKKDRELEAARQENANLRAENDILRSHSPLQLYLWPPPTPVQTSVTEWSINQDTLRQMIGAQDIDLSDLFFVDDRRHELPAKQRARAEHVVNDHAFQRWVASTSSAKLLVCWDQCSKVADVSPLTVFCATLATALRAQPRFLSALWFCGRHHDQSEAPLEAGLGPRGMLRSLIDQLLRQWTFNTSSLCHTVSLSGLQSGDLEEQINLLEWLVLQVPESMTLFFIIDGVVFFERPNEVLEETMRILARLLRLIEDPRVRTTIKVLFTSAPGTDVISFEEEDLILKVDSMPITESVPSEERLARELNAW